MRVVRRLTNRRAGFIVGFFYLFLHEIKNKTDFPCTVKYFSVHLQKKSLKLSIMKLYLRPKGENGLPLHPIANVEECMKSYDKVLGNLYTEEEVEVLLETL